MGFYLQDDMWEAVSNLPRKNQDEIAGSLARLYFTGEETPLKGVQGPRSALAETRRERQAKRKQKPSKPPSKREAKAKQTNKQTRIKIEPFY